ncbi:MAG TPA: DUF4402 domain-containing protein [Sphingomicrobium sp.]|nr:DUF4402 domain-containing protein [Sphingomicrobium sp.]
MKKIVISAGALAALAVSTPALAANTAQATATVDIVSPLTLTNTSPLNFGTIIGPFNGEVVEMSSGGSRTCPGTLTCTSAAVSAADFTVAGTVSQALKVTVDPSVTLNGSISGTLNVDLTTDLPGAVSTDTSGNATFGVGGSLAIPLGTADGVYSGKFNVTVQYQ